MASQVTGAIADRYSAALFELAEQQGLFDVVAKDLLAFKAMIAESEDLRRLLRSPVIGRDDQRRAITALAERGGMSDLTRRFVGTVAANRRLFSLPGIIGAYLAKLADRRGEIRAEVVSSAPLDDAQRDRLNAVLGKSLGGAVVIEETVDPGLLGGLVVQVGSRMVDSSLRTKLQHLQLAMKGVQ
ncbi:MAG: F0F1 ATP synthase subunit delta [Alphaproteobacteria bacterium]|nr:F0F1 ATP synthase subunit delta [Alphaproteobacteria bacterium]